MTGSNLKILASIVLLGAACASPDKRSYSVVFDQDAIVYTKEDRKLNVKAGEAVEITSGPALIVREQFQTVLLLPIPEKTSKVEVHLPQDENLKSKGLDPASAFNQIAQAIMEIQRLLAQKEPDLALSQIQTLRAQHPQFSYIRFLEASCYLLKSDLDKAKEIATFALKEFPNDPVGNAFVETLNSLNSNGSMQK